MGGAVEHEAHNRLILVTGATGYIGGRLVPLLLAAGYRVRVFVRDPVKLTDVPWAERVEVATGDLLDRDSVRAACTDAHVVYYLVHSMGAVGRADSFEVTETRAARTLAAAAHDRGVRRVVYLGGLHPEDARLSRHLRSRAAVGDTLRDAPVPAVVLQAGVVIGSGSASFEMIRHLTDVLPWMPAPRWVNNHIQPIAIRDVLYYLVAAAALPGNLNRTLDIGGLDVLTYGEMMNGYAAEAGLPRRHILALPVLTPRLAAHWVNLVTPIPRRLAMPLVESLQNDCVMANHAIDAVIPPPEEGLTPYRRAVRLALGKMRTGQVDTSWRNSEVLGAPSDPLPSDPDWAGYTVYTDVKQRDTSATPADLWRTIEGIGGDRGWYSFPLAWALRGWADKLVGGVGLRRGRRDPDRLQTGDALDFWRVEYLDRGRTLRLRAEMRVPGRAWLEMTVQPTPTGSHYHQRAVFFPRGLWGRLYWYSILPFHGVIFSGMANRITATARAETMPESASR